MRKMVKTGAAALMLTCMAGNVWAATAAAAGCVKPDEITALKAAAVQQRLMVAALSCDAVKLYNDFVRSYQKELQASDRALQNFFRRLNGATGTEDFHAYKTRLANASSMQSIGNILSYCANAKASFDASLGEQKSTLATFVLSQDAFVDGSFTPCPVVAATTAGVSAPLANVPLPKPKPADIVPAQGGGLSAPN